MSLWTEKPEAEDYLRKLVAGTKMSTALIAGEMNERFNARLTRNAIIGKCKRLNLSLPLAGGWGAGSETRSRSGRSPKPRRPRIVHGERNRFVCLPVEIAPAEEENGTPIDGGVRLPDLQSHHCRWPYGEPTADMLCCGQRIFEGSTYEFCAFHLRKATNRLADVRDAA